MAVGIIVLLSILYYVMETKKQYLESYMGKTEKQQREIRKNLNSGDLVMTLTGVVYKIESLNDTIMKVTKSNIPVSNSNIYKPIDEEVHLESSFDANTLIVINRISFLKYGLVNENLNHEYGNVSIYQVLDR